MQDKSIDSVISIWSCIVDVQKHFNDISLRIRGMFITIVIALFAATGFLLDSGPAVTVADHHVAFYVVVPLFGVFATYLFYFMDRYWYHRLLVGSVKQAVFIEEMYSENWPEMSLGRTIGKESAINPTGFTRYIAGLTVSDSKYKEKGELHSDGKIELFYKSMMWFLLVVTAGLALLGGVSKRSEGAVQESPSINLIIKSMEAGSIDTDSFGPAGNPGMNDLIIEIPTPPAKSAR